jgi:mono/diheme cytochrome c family protein
MNQHRSLWLLLPLLLVACGGDAPAPRPQAKPRAANAPSPARVAAEAKVQYVSLCSACHGTSGHGDGPGSGPLNPKPRSFADVAWQDSVTEDHIEKTIVLGGAAVGKSPMMPAQPQLKGNDALLAELVKIVRGFKGK